MARFSYLLLPVLFIIAPSTFSMFPGKNRKDIEEEQIREAIRRSNHEYAVERATQRAIQQSLKEQGPQSSTPIEHKNKQLLQPTRIEYLTVLQQKGLDCGFHAVKNAFLIYKHLTNQITRKKLLRDLKNPLVFNMQKWKELLTKRGKSTTNFTEDEIYTIARLGKLPKHNFFAFNNIQQFDPNFIQNSNVVIRRLCQAIRNLKRAPTATYIFIIGSMQVSQTGTKGTNGHWITVVVHKQAGRITYYVADSLGRPRARTRLVDALTTVLNNDPNQLEAQQELMVFTSLLTSAQTIVREQKINQYDRVINELGRLMLSSNVTNNKKFIDNYLAQVVSLFSDLLNHLNTLKKGTEQQYNQLIDIFHKIIPVASAQKKIVRDVKSQLIENLLEISTNSKKRTLIMNCLLN